MAVVQGSGGGGTKKVVIPKITPKVPSSPEANKDWNTIKKATTPNVVIPSLSVNPETRYVNQSAEMRRYQMDMLFQKGMTSIAQSKALSTSPEINKDWKTISGATTPTKPNYDPLGIGGVGTPAELAAGFGFGPSSYVWREDKAVLEDAKLGITNLYGADLAAQQTWNYINNFGYPSFFTPYVQNKLGYSDAAMEELGYVQDPSGNWVRTKRGTPGGGTAGGGGGGGGGGRSYGPSSGSFSGGYGWGQVNWRIS